MNTKKAKKVVKKNVKVAKAKGDQLKAMAKSEYAKLKKDMNISPAKAKELEKKAIKEYEKVKKQMEKTAKQAESYMKKNPGKSALISAGIGAALAGAAALMMSGKKNSKKRK
ncbi:MAG: hypothetical protein ACD_56C00123G0007 [uncultured bacterium]|nr:MAG: hypothetical protein ACD_56C00123G0007 [uncultured bacterium]